MKMKNINIIETEDTLSAEIEFPRNNVIKKIEIGLMDVRSADSIQIEYDFVRDGWIIKQASKFQWESDDPVCDPDWKEVSFIKAWERADLDSEDEDD